MKKQKKRFTVIFIIAVVLIAAITAIVITPSAVRRSEINKQFEIAQQFLNELDYESAIFAFNKILEIDPNNAEAREAMHTAYHSLVHQYLDAYDIRAQQVWTDMKTVLSLAEDEFYVTEVHAQRCGENDVKTVFCLHCGQTWDFLGGSDSVDVFAPLDASAASGRHIVDGSVTIEKACGVILTTCQCGEILQSETGEHLWDDGILTSPATFEADGERIYTCSGCGETRVEVLLQLVDAEFVISDPQLEAGIRERISKPTGTLMLSDVQYLDSLHLSDMGIVDITALAKLPNLRSLDLERNSIRDFSPLKDLIYLESLCLDRCGITDISMLSSLTNLDSLYLNFNQISDLTPLSSLKKLRILELRENQISDLTPLSGLTSLYWMFLEWNQIRDLTPLANLTEMGELMIDGNQISDITPLRNMTKMHTLSLNDNPISDISALSGMAEMRDLRMVNNPISDISALAGMSQLEELQLVNNQVSNLEPLRNLAKLEQVFLYNNPITDFSPVMHVELVAY